MKHSEIVAQKMDLSVWQIENVIHLLDDGATTPFISRYRKEMSGSLDEVQVTQIKREYTLLREIDARREYIIKSIEDQEKMTPILLDKINGASTMPELEDIYLPYKPKRRTLATIAREKGLEPLAKIVYKQQERAPELVAQKFLSEDVANIEEALQGAKDIIAEWVNETESVRQEIRKLFSREAVIGSRVVRGKEAEGIKFKDYFDWAEALKKCPSHRLLAMLRGEKEGFLRISIKVEDDDAIEKLNTMIVKGSNNSSILVAEAIEDSWKRLLAPSMERESKGIAKSAADADAIAVFADNLRQLLLSSPLGEKNVLAIDPGFRTGCKVVCLDRHGNLLHNETIYPHPPANQTSVSVKKIISLVDAYRIEAIAIGNGTAGRETENFIRNWVRFRSNIEVYVVSESGASIYSASPIAREEFPDYDVTVRGAVSIGRRLMDPLSELVKIDPQSIGVGQYQHDVEQSKLKEALDDVVISCVNAVGVEINTASKHLLTYVSGVGEQIAQNIVDYRTEHGAFKSRKELMNVKRMGKKVFEQAAGFLRIRNAANPLDNSAVHPESYCIVEKMAKDVGCSVADLINDDTKRSKINLQQYISDTVGLPTLNDIISELAKPGRDPRSKIGKFSFADIHSIDDLSEGMVVPGIVTNITKFGAFIDIGIKQAGLVHISQLAKGYIDNPLKIVKLNQHVRVKILSIDKERNRVQLTMKEIIQQNQ